MIIGITGTDGAGKGAAVAYLASHKGFTHYSSRELIMTEIEARGLPVDRDQMRLVANDLRREYGNDMIVKKALERMHSEEVTDVVIESIRALAEVETLKAAGGILLAIDADQALRYQRITGRGSASDNVTYEQFQAQEAKEMNDPDPNGMQKAAVIAAADYVIINNESLSRFHSDLEQFLESVGNV